MTRHLRGIYAILNDPLMTSEHFLAAVEGSLSQAVSGCSNTATKRPPSQLTEEWQSATSYSSYASNIRYRS